MIYEERDARADSRREQHVADEIRRANSFFGWIQKLAWPVTTGAFCVGLSVATTEMRVRDLEEGMRRDAEDDARVRSIDPDGFRDPAIRSGVDRQIRAALRDPDFFDNLQFKLERVYKLDTLRK